MLGAAASHFGQDSLSRWWPAAGTPGSGRLALPRQRCPGYRQEKKLLEGFGAGGWEELPKPHILQCKGSAGKMGVGKGLMQAGKRRVAVCYQQLDVNTIKLPEI